MLSRVKRGGAMHFDEAVWLTALTLSAQYGDDAEIIATLRAAEYAAAGDTEALAQWEEIIACLARLSEDGRPPGPLN